MKICKGITRFVVVIGNYAFKFPRINFSSKGWLMGNFLRGCLENWMERHLWKEFSNPQDEECRQIHFYLAPSLFCSWFGFLQIQRKVNVCETLEESEISPTLRMLCGGDIKARNFGYYKGRLVCLDYGSSS